MWQASAVSRSVLSSGKRASMSVLHRWYVVWAGDSASSGASARSAV